MPDREQIQAAFAELSVTEAEIRLLRGHFDGDMSSAAWEDNVPSHHAPQQVRHLLEVLADRGISEDHVRNFVFPPGRIS